MSREILACVEREALRNFEPTSSGESFCETMAAKFKECEEDTDEGSLRDSCADEFAILFSDEFLEDFEECHASTSCDNLRQCWDDAPKKFPLENQAMDSGVLAPLFLRFLRSRPNRTVCDEAATIAEEECGVEFDDDPDGEPAECTGDAEAYAQCTVDHSDAFCAFLDHPLVENNEYADCVAEVGE